MNSLVNLKLWHHSLWCSSSVRVSPHTQRGFVPFSGGCVQTLCSHTCKLWLGESDTFVSFCENWDPFWGYTKFKEMRWVIFCHCWSRSQWCCFFPRGKFVLGYPQNRPGPRWAHLNPLLFNATYQVIVTTSYMCSSFLVRQNPINVQSTLLMKECLEKCRSFGLWLISGSLLETGLTWKVFQLYMYFQWLLSEFHEIFC